MKLIKVNANTAIPILGFGTWKLEPADAFRCVTEALKVGYRHIDTAKVYNNEAAVGDAINKSGVTREDIFLTTKLWKEFLKKDQVRKECVESLKRLKQDYVDLYLMHWPDKNVPIQETFEALQELKQEGLIKAFGVSNFTIHHLQDALKTGIEFVNNQVEFRPTLYQKELVEFCHENNISLTAYCPIGQGKDLELPEVLELAEKYDKSPAQVVLNWIASRGVIAIPRSSKPERILDNFKSTEWELSAEDAAKLDNLSDGQRICNPDFNEFDY